MSTKKQREDFLKRVEAFVESVGGEDHPNVARGSYGSTLQMETVFGNLALWPRSAEKRDRLWTIFAKFDEPERAREKLPCNPFSGKWNFHGNDPEYLFADFKRQLGGIVGEAAC